MENSFEVLQWESTSKEQDSLVDQLFGEISDSAARKTSASGSLSDKTNKLTSKREKRKALDNEKSPEKAKKKLKDKREKNKFKADKKCNSHHPEFSADQSETAVCLACDENVTSVKETNKGVSINGTNQINQSKKGKRKSSHDDESAGKLEKKRKDKKKKNKFKSDEKLDSQLTGVNEGVTVDGINTSEQDVLVDFGMPLEAESDPHKSGQESVEPKRNKAKKKKRKEKSTEDDADSDHELPDLGQSTLRTKHKHKRMKTEKEHEQGCSEPTKNHSECLKSLDKNVTSVPQKKSSPHEKMTKQLESSRFRWINEQLYTTTGDEAMAMFSNNPRLFDVYHWGFSNQVKLWPINPVNKIIEWLKKRPTSHVVADFGCGEAVIAQSIANKVHSFDLVARNTFVTACNMAKVPLTSASVDVAVFCLSLMGTNLVDFLREAHRVLKVGGILKVAEVTSRIKDTTEFVKSLSSLAFKLHKEDTSNKMFVFFDFIKDKESVKKIPSHKLEGLKLKPCIYKKR